MRGGSLLLFFALVLFFPLPSDQIGGGFLVCYFFLSFSFICFFLCSDGMEREACVCDHGFERSDLCAEIIINNNNVQTHTNVTFTLNCLVRFNPLTDVINSPSPKHTYILYLYIYLFFIYLAISFFASRRSDSSSLDSC